MHKGFPLLHNCIGAQCGGVASQIGSRHCTLTHTHCCVRQQPQTRFQRKTSTVSDVHLFSSAYVSAWWCVLNLFRTLCLQTGYLCSSPSCRMLLYVPLILLLPH
jgi:hypothetical protein